MRRPAFIRISKEIILGACVLLMQALAHETTLSTLSGGNSVAEHESFIKDLVWVDRDTIEGKMRRRLCLRSGDCLGATPSTRSQLVISTD